MTMQRTWLWVGGVIIVAAAARALGTPLETLFLLALILICPLMMYFMMRGGMGRQQRSDHAEMNRQAGAPEPRRTSKESERQTTQDRYGERP